MQQHVDPTRIEAALAATGTATLRRRRLPAEQVLWLVLGIALYRDRSIVEGAATLDLALPSARGSIAAAPNAIVQARAYTARCMMRVMEAEGALASPRVLVACNATLGGAWYEPG